jgi:Flp pilus assembly pilin Flp
MMELFRRFLREDQGATVIEYCVIAAVSALVMLVGFQLVGDAVFNLYTFLQTTVGGATS